jgi:DNA-binding NarL/FixJ family response regulator
VIRIMLVEDHAILREALANLLSLDPRMKVVGQASDGPEALALLPSAQSTLILVDLSLPGMHGVELIREIRRSHPHIKLLVLTGHLSHSHVHAALKAGANGYIVKGASYSELATGINSVMNNKTYLSPSVADAIVSDYLARASGEPEVASPWHRLSPRERTVLKLLAEGARNKDIAEYLCVSVRTAEKHRANLMNKLNLHSTAALAAFAIEHGLTGPDVRADWTQKPSIA